MRSRINRTTFSKSLARGSGRVALALASGPGRGAARKARGGGRRRRPGLPIPTPA